MPALSRSKADVRGDPVGPGEEVPPKLEETEASGEEVASPDGATAGAAGEGEAFVTCLGGLVRVVEELD